MIKPERNTNEFNLASYASQSSIGRLATPVSHAALATAGAIFRIKRGSKGFGMI